MSEKNFSALAEYFKSKGVTQSAIAEKLGVSKAYVNSLMTGKKAFGKAQAAKWNEMFGISASWLLTGEGDMIPPVETDAKDAIKSRITQYIEATNSAASVRDFLLKAGLSASFISGLSRGIGRDAKEKIQRTYTSLNVGYNQWIYPSVNQQLTEGHFLTADVLADAFAGYLPQKGKKEASRDYAPEASEHTQTPLWEVTASPFSF